MRDGRGGVHQNRAVLIRSYGLFWEASEIDWYPGRGHKFEMLGRRGVNRPGVRVADFRDQRGLYVLYGNYGPYYVGLARDRGIGLRVKDHLSDSHAGNWHRFSWFGFRRVLKRVDDRGLGQLSSPSQYAAGSTRSIIADMEALLIKALGLPSNFADMNFPGGEEWTQVDDHDRLWYLDQVAPG